MDKNENLLEIAQAEQSLQSFGETVACLRNNIFQIMQQGEQLAQVRANYCNGLQRTTRRIFWSKSERNLEELASS